MPGILQEFVAAYSDWELAGSEFWQILRFDAVPISALPSTRCVDHPTRHSTKGAGIVPAVRCSAAAMSPVAKSRNGPKDKGSDKGKEWKASTRHSPGSGVGTNAYNPGSGTFLRLDSSIPETMVVNQTSRFRSIDCADDVGNIVVDSDDFGSIIGSYSDSVSNNGSCSGESEDQTHQLHGKAKKPGQSHPPGLVGSGGSDKRDKIRYKNEKKHQRQKERRAQELRDRCTNYLMSRKLEALVQQLVAMGFPSERATMALILNEGHVERSVAWLLEGGEGEVKENWNDNLKIDISEEQARIAELEFRFKYQRVEIERGVVACEGDLEKAAEWLRERHPQLPTPVPRHPQSPTPVPPAVASSATIPGSNYSNNVNNKERSKDQNFPTPAEAAPYLVNVQGRRSSGLYEVLNNQRREENELQSNPNRFQGQQQSSLRPTGTVERSFPLGRTVPQNSSEWQRLSSNISGQYLNDSSVRTSLHGSPTSPQSFPVPVRHVAGTRVSVADNGLPFRKEQTSHLTRDPVVISQLSQSPITPPNIRPSPASPTLSPSSWNGNGLSSSSPSSILYFNVPPGETLAKGGMNKAPGKLFTKPVEDTVHVEPVQSNVYSVWGHTGSFGSRDIDAQSSGPRATASYSRSQSTPAFSSGWGSGLTGASSDWSMWMSGACDYKTIDWSMGPSTSTSDTNVWDVTNNLASLLKLSDSGKPRLGIVVGEGTSRGLTASREDVTSGVNYNLWSTSNRANPVITGLQDKSLSETGSSPSMGVPEWTSPFTGKDLFSLPHEAASPSL
ncbi:hypothetical protein R1sor_018385 [Riccia sorocarpa]|uniref:UBA domain-containing protein n=1 Tax=Riccia sorocarpa TaxID=122646 RepID=A0ABD3I9K0_9MARC